MDEDVIARIRRLEDREAIRTLTSTYSLAVDDQNFPLLGSLWAPQARYGYVGEAPQAEGQPAIAALLTERIGAMGPSFHVNHDTLVEWDPADPDRATGVVMCHAEVTPAAGQFIGAIRYRDRYLRHDGKWLFEERLLSFLYYARPAEYDGILQSDTPLTVFNPPRARHWPQR